MNFSTVGLTAFQGRIDSFLLGETKALSKRNIPMALGAIAATFYAASIVKGFRAEVVEPLLKKCVSSYPDAKKIFDEYIKEPQSILYQKQNYDRHKGAASFLIGLQVVAILVTLSTSGTTKKIAFYTNIFLAWPPMPFRQMRIIENPTSQWAELELLAFSQVKNG